MGRIKFILILSILISVNVVLAQNTLPQKNLEQTIFYLLNTVAKCDCTFIRNGKPHTPQEAFEHMKAKYEHFKKEIKTPEDFIRLAASKRMMTGQPYLIKTKAGKEMECAVWLTQLLENYRKNISE